MTPGRSDLKEEELLWLPVSEYSLLRDGQESRSHYGNQSAKERRFWDHIISEELAPARIHLSRFLQPTYPAPASGARASSGEIREPGKRIGWWDRTRTFVRSGSWVPTQWQVTPGFSPLTVNCFAAFTSPLANSGLPNLTSHSIIK